MTMSLQLITIDKHYRQEYSKHVISLAFVDKD